MMRGMEVPKTVRDLAEERNATIVANGTVEDGEVHVHESFAIDEEQNGQRIEEADREVPTKDVENLVKAAFAEHYPHDKGPGELHVMIRPDGEIRLQFFVTEQDEFKHRQIHGITE